MKDLKMEKIVSDMHHKLFECTTIEQIRDVVVRASNDMKPIAWDENNEKTELEKMLIYQHISTLQFMCEILGKWKGF